MKSIPILTTLIALAATPSLAASASSGQKVFRKCAGCHSVGANAVNKSGPVLTDVIGRRAGTYKGFRYSKTLQAAGKAGLVWTPDLVANYVADPKKFMAKFLNDRNARPAMRFQLKSARDRANVAAYLASLK